MAKKVIGIDLGTTNSAVAAVEGGQSRRGTGHDPSYLSRSKPLRSHPGSPL